MTIFKSGDRVIIRRGEHAGKDAIVTTATGEGWVSVSLSAKGKTINEQYQEAELEPFNGIASHFDNMVKERPTVASNVFEATKQVYEQAKKISDLENRLRQIAKAQTDASAQIRVLSSFTTAIAKTAEPEQPKRKNVEVKFESWVFGSVSGTKKLQSLLNEGWEIKHEQTVAQGKNLVYTVRLERENVIKVSPENATAKVTLQTPKTAIVTATPININLEAGVEALTRMAQEGMSEDEILHQAQVMSLYQTLGMIDTATQAQPQPTKSYSAYVSARTKAKQDD